MRKSCLECVAKHLGSAAVYIEETMCGYPNYYGYVYGELDHAASECLSEFPDLAAVIREHRIMWANTRRSEYRVHKIPFEALFTYIDSVEETGVKLDLLDEVLDGLPRDDEGNVVYSMDTRPGFEKDDQDPETKEGE